MTQHIDVKGAVKAMERMAQQFMPGWEGGAACKARETILALQRRVEELEREINTPEIIDFVKAVQIEAAHQRQRWGTEHDEGKTPCDWFWLLGYLGGKALRNLMDGNRQKGLHHVITTAAACANWHLYETGKDKRMRPGIESPKVDA